MANFHYYITVRRKCNDFLRLAFRQELCYILCGDKMKKKIQGIQEAILDGEADAAPYELSRKNACTYCPYGSVCGFDKKLPGYEFRRLKAFSDEELWKAFAKEVQ